MKLILIIFCLFVMNLCLIRKHSSFLKIKDDELDFDDNKLKQYENEITDELEKEEKMSSKDMEIQDLNNEAEIDQKELQDEIHHDQEIENSKHKDEDN